MINDSSLAAIEASRLPSGFLKPLYETYSFSQIPKTILSLFGCGPGGLPKDCVKAGRYERVILILIDGFGWKFLEKHQSRYPFLTQFFKEGIVSKITSQFPSTTAAHITTLCSNQEVGQHGIYEWFIYEPLLDRVVAPLPYVFAGDKNGGALASKMDPARFFPKAHFFEELQKQGIPSIVLQHSSIAHSIYSTRMFQGAHCVGYKNWRQALTLLEKHLQSPGFFYLYYGDFDSQAHRHGFESPQAIQALDRCFQGLEGFSTVGGSTALIVAADHGMIDVHPETTFYLNEQMPELEKSLKKGADGRALVPAGSCRDFFLHVNPPELMEVQNKLELALKEIAWVCPTTQLIQEGFFGSLPPSDRFQERVGNLAILAKGSHSIWWHEKGRFEQNFHAMHGSLTPDEMETIFLFR